MESNDDLKSDEKRNSLHCRSQKGLVSNSTIMSNDIEDKAYEIKNHDKNMDHVFLKDKKV